MQKRRERFRPDLDTFWKRYLPAMRSMTEEQVNILFESGTIDFDVDPCPAVDANMKVKSVWKVGKKWNVSYQATKESNKAIWDEIREDALHELKSYRPKQPRIKRVKTRGKKLHLLSLSDIHFGKEVKGETGRRVHTVVDELLSRLDKKKDKEFLFIIGNDILNTDFGQSTSRGTPQFNYSEPKQTFREATNFAIEVIQKLLSLGTVHLIHVPSNHDYYRGTYLYDCVCQRFYNDNNVTFEETFDDRQYYQFGKVGFMFEHGELKINDYEVIFATEAPNIFCGTTTREVILGHLHHEQVHQKKGCKIRVLSSLSGSDAWHKKKAYISPKQQQLFVYDAEKGLETIHEVTEK